MSGDKDLLERELGKLLGFDDGALDVLEHLLSIESEEDLLEYLSQLLGESTTPVLEFVKNVGRFNRGEKVQILVEDSKPAADATKKEDSNTAKESPETESPKVASKASTSKKELMQARRQKQTKSRVPPPKKKQAPPVVKAATPQPPPEDKKEAGESKKQALKAKTKDARRKSKPIKGTPKVVCGCFGTKHKALTNCLYCGRIACVEEGYDFCAFCGNMIENVVRDQKVDENDRAWIHKERLLQFDRDSAQRTQVIDDHEDFQSATTWMNEDELQQNEEKAELQRQATKRPKQVLNLAL